MLQRTRLADKSLVKNTCVKSNKSLHHCHHSYHGCKMLLVIIASFVFRLGGNLHSFFGLLKKIHLHLSLSLPSPHWIRMLLFRLYWMPTIILISHFSCSSYRCVLYSSRCSRPNFCDKTNFQHLCCSELFIRTTSSICILSVQLTSIVKSLSCLFKLLVQPATCIQLLHSI